MKTKGICSACGQEVLVNNSTLLLELIVDKIMRYGADYTEDQVVHKMDYDIALLFHPWRHLLPVTEYGKVICGGTPSSAQYLDESLPKQPNYDMEKKDLYIGAYKRMMAWATALIAATNSNAPRA